MSVASGFPVVPKKAPRPKTAQVCAPIKDVPRFAEILTVAHIHLWQDRPTFHSSRLHCDLLVGAATLFWVG